jgi:hypothetical protein
VDVTTEENMKRGMQTYWYARGTDGVDNTFDIYAPGEEQPFTSVAFWDAEEWAEAHARRVVAALNTCDGVPTEALEQGVTERQPYRHARVKDEREDSFDIYGPQGERAILGVSVGDCEAEAEAKARRVVAVLNACEGISTVELEGALRG